MMTLTDFEMGSLFSIIQVGTFYTHESLKQRNFPAFGEGERKKEEEEGTEREGEICKTISFENAGRGL